MGSKTSKYIDNYNSELSLFQSNTKLTETVKSWEAGENDTLIYRDGGDAVPGTVLSGANKGKPVFQFIPVKPLCCGGTMVIDSDNCYSIIPAGFRNGKTVNTMNPVRYEIGGTSSLMSILHVLVIPKDKRIYNALTLGKEHMGLLFEMRKVGYDSIVKLMNGSEEMIGSLQWNLKQDSMIEMNNGDKLSSKITKSDITPNGNCQFNFNSFTNSEYLLTNAKEDIIKKSINHYFHVGRASSIGYLHLHTTANCFNTYARDVMETDAVSNGYIKNTPLQEVIKYLNSKVIHYQDVANEVEPEPEPEPDDDYELSRQSSRWQK